MEQAIQNKIDRIKALAASSRSSNHFIVSEPLAFFTSDNLSKSIRNKKDAELFQYELKAAFGLAGK